MSKVTFQNHGFDLSDLIKVNPFFAHSLLSSHIEHKKKAWFDTTILVDATDAEYDINISEHPVYKYRFAENETPRTNYASYIDEMLDSRGMRKQDLRNLCGKRLGVNPDHVHGDVLKGKIIQAMIEREREIANVGTLDKEVEVYEARDPNHRYRSHTKVRNIPRWWMPEKVESRAVLANLTSIVTPQTIERVEDRFSVVDIVNNQTWQPADRSGSLAQQKKKYREQLWALIANGHDTAIRNMAGKLLCCESSDSWYGQILRGAVIWSVNEYIEKFKGDSL